MTRMMMSVALRISHVCNVCHLPFLGIIMIPIKSDFDGVHWGCDIGELSWVIFQNEFKSVSFFSRD